MSKAKKELLGLYLSEAEGANNWLPLLTFLHNCSVEDILNACVDGLTGFPEAISTIYPDTEVRQCVIHQICSSMKYVASKHQKEFMADLKPVYRAVSKEAAEIELDRLESKWCQQYPIVLHSGEISGKVYLFTQISRLRSKGHLHHKCHRGSTP